MNLRTLTNSELHQSTQASAQRERLATKDVLIHLRENERRMLYAEMGYPSLKSFCVAELKFSEGSAWRRINAMRLIREIPEVENQIDSGELNLTQVALAQTFFRQTKPLPQEKKAVLTSLINLTGDETKRILAERAPHEYTLPSSQERPIKGGNLEVTLLIDMALQKDLEEIELLLNKKLSKLELIQLMATEMLTKLRKKNQPQKGRSVAQQLPAKNKYSDQQIERPTHHEGKKPADKQRYGQPPRQLKNQHTQASERSNHKCLELREFHIHSQGDLRDAKPLWRGIEEARTEIIEVFSKKKSSHQSPAVASVSSSVSNLTPNRTAKPKSASRYIPREIDQAVRSRDHRQCVYQDLATGKRCSARHFLQIEHRHPFSRGGESTMTNLELLCPAHNRLRALQQLGKNKISRFVASLI